MVRHRGALAPYSRTNMPSYGHTTANECPVVMFEGKTESARASLNESVDVLEGPWNRLFARTRNVAELPTGVDVRCFLCDC